jgi:hypothetical protein
LLAVLTWQVLDEEARIFLFKGFLSHGALRPAAAAAAAAMFACLQQHEQQQT